MHDKVTNPFLEKDAPSDYHDFRPYYHETPFALLAKYCQNERYQYALDVACGTGHSTEALHKISERVTGIDSSIPMIEEARRRYPGMDIREAYAEVLPFPARTFDLVNISMGLHWVKHDKFIAEASRVLKPKGIFSVDNYGFGGVVSDDGELQEVHFDFFNKFLPSVPRHTTYPEDGLLKINNFVLIDDEVYEVTLNMDKEKFIRLIKTMSNFLTLSEQEKESTSAEMERVYDHIFKNDELALKFGGRIKIYSKES